MDGELEPALQLEASAKALYECMIVGLSKLNFHEQIAFATALRRGVAWEDLDEAPRKAVREIAKEDK